jgi:hypothetical protein
MFSQEVSVARRHPPSDFNLALRIQDSHRQIRDLLETSAALQLPVFSNFRRVPKISAGNPLTAFDSNASVALGIYLNESLSIPKIATLEDVLKLRNDQRIKFFRNKIFQWCEKLRAGNLGSEEEIRREIREANAAIEDIGKYKKVAMWMTFLSVPVGIVELLTGLPISLLTFTPLGVVIEIANLVKERQYRWLLFGR